MGPRVLKGIFRFIWRLIGGASALAGLSSFFGYEAADLAVLLKIWLPEGLQELSDNAVALVGLTLFGIFFAFLWWIQYDAKQRSKHRFDRKRTEYRHKRAVVHKAVPKNTRPKAK